MGNIPCAIALDGCTSKEDALLKGPFSDQVWVIDTLITYWTVVKDQCKKVAEKQLECQSDAWKHLNNIGAKMIVDSFFDFSKDARTEWIKKENDAVIKRISAGYSLPATGT